MAIPASHTLHHVVFADLPGRFPGSLLYVPLFQSLPHPCSSSPLAVTFLDPGVESLLALSHSRPSWDELDALITTWLRPPDGLSPALGVMFPLLSSASTFSDVIDLSIRKMATSADLGAARTAGEALLAEPSTALDLQQVSADMAAIQTFGIFSFLAGRQLARRHLMVGPPAMDLTVPGSLLCSRLSHIVYGTNRWFYPTGYVPNNGVNFRVYRDSFAPHAAVAAHFVKLHRAGKYVILRASFWRAYAAKHAIPYDFVHCFLAPKDGTPLMRLVANPTHMIDPAKKWDLTYFWGAMYPPQLYTICFLLLSAYRAFPGVPIYIARRDVDAAYTRVPVALQDVLHMIFPFVHQGVESVAIPLVSVFGNPDSNFHFNVVTTLLLQRSRARTSAWVPGPHEFVFSAMATDDLIIVGPHDLVQAELEATAVDIPMAVGEGGISLHKDLFAPAVEVVGYHFDARTGSTSLSQKAYTSLVDCFFNPLEIPVVGFPCPTSRLQRIASLAIRYADFFPLLAPFSRGFTQCLSPDSPTSLLSSRAVLDWVMWRILLRHSADHTGWFTRLVDRPVLFYSPRDESPAARALRHSRAAHFCLFLDACTFRAGVGIYGPGIFTSAFDLGALRYFLHTSGLLHSVNINILEFLAAIIGAIIYIIRYLPSDVSPAHPFHLHIWTDNSTTYWSVRKARASHPLCNVLLQMLALVQLKYSVCVTSGPIEGRLNIHADALSRNFEVPDGVALREFLRPLPHLRIMADFTRIFTALALLPPGHPSLPLRAALIALESIIGYVSAVPTTSL